MPSIGAVINLYREGIGAVPTIRSALEAVRVARDAGLTCRLLAVLDTSNARTAEVVASFDGVEALATDVDDLGLARNVAVAALTDCDYIGFLDGDDLWDRAWLAQAHAALVQAGDCAIAHPRYSIEFGGVRDIRIAIDSDDPTFDPEALRVTNYWTSLSVARRAVYERFPYRPNAAAEGWSYEDWNWNCRTLAAGYRHLAVEGGIHFIRKRSNSMSATAIASSALARPTEVSTYAFSERWAEARRPGRSR